MPWLLRSRVFQPQSCKRCHSSPLSSDYLNTISPPNEIKQDGNLLEVLFFNFLARHGLFSDFSFRVFSLVVRNCFWCFYQLGQYKIKCAARVARLLEFSKLGMFPWELIGIYYIYIFLSRMLAVMVLNCDAFSSAFCSPALCYHTTVRVIV